MTMTKLVRSGPLVVCALIELIVPWLVAPHSSCYELRFAAVAISSSKVSRISLSPVRPGFAAEVCFFFRLSE
jgi:hypothetical protein